MLETVRRFEITVPGSGLGYFGESGGYAIPTGRVLSPRGRTQRYRPSRLGTGKYE